MKATFFMRSGSNKGFTLIEVLIAVAMIGALTMILAPLFSDLSVAQGSAWRERQKLVNRWIADALVSYAAQYTVGGTLPAPYTDTGTKIHNGVANPANTNLVTLLQQNGVAQSEINGDGSAGDAIRVYQMITPADLTTPIYFQAGPQVLLRYNFGVVYATRCNRADTACNTNTVPPGTGSAALSSLTWASSGTDFGEAFVSTLPLQKTMLTETTRRLDRVRDALLSYFRGKQIAAAANDTTNFYPNSNPAATSGALSQGCWYGWIDLSSGAGKYVMDAVGLSQEEFARTAWGARIEYCRDYDASGTGSADASPHYGALRINKNVSQSLAPSATQADNIFLTF